MPDQLDVSQNNKTIKNYFISFFPEKNKNNDTGHLCLSTVEAIPGLGDRRQEGVDLHSGVQNELHFLGVSDPPPPPPNPPTAPSFCVFHSLVPMTSPHTRTKIESKQLSFVVLCPLDPLSNTRTHTHTHTIAGACTHTHAQSLALSLTPAHTHPQTDICYLGDYLH